jgi:predicted DNA-binding transcriptional regulator AlpA
MPGRYGTGNVLAVTGWSASNLWNRIRDGRFPRPQRDGNRAWWPTHIVREALGL